MIKVFVKYLDKNIASIEVSGHANSDEHGKDLVCAAVSGVVVGCLNNIKTPKDFLITHEPGHVKIEAKKSISTHDAIVLETLLVSLKTIEEDNKKYLSIFTK